MEIPQQDVYTATLNNAQPPVWNSLPYEAEEKVDKSHLCHCQRLREGANLSEIISKAKDGCSHCQLLSSGVHLLTSEIREDTRTEIKIITKDREQFIKVRLDDGSSVNLDYFTTNDTYDGCDAVRIAQLISEPLSAQFFAKIRSWANECQTTHNLCARSYLWSLTNGNFLNFSTIEMQKLLVQEPPLPSRVIHIDLEKKERVRLLETKGKRGRYMTLSHCWGSVQPMKTTKRTITFRKYGIKWNKLPRTFQDAINIAKGLGVQYLWIDSLCIIQDDDDDWNNEASKMASIYEHSWLTIAAMAASDGTKGCFCLPHGERTLAHSQEIPQTRENSPKVFVRKEAGLHTQASIYPFPDPLNSRSWVYQEYLLSRRLLKIYEHEMVWECNEAQACECSQKMHDGGEKEELTMHIYHEVRNDWQLIELWDKIVKFFLLRKITFEKDKLSAILGIGKRFGSTRSVIGRCVFGHFEGWLLASLLWQVYPYNGGPWPEGRRIGHDAPPSWSWASLKGSWSYARPPIELSISAVLLDTSFQIRRDCEKCIDDKYIKLSGRTISTKLNYTPIAKTEALSKRYRLQAPSLDSCNEFSANTYIDTVLGEETEPLMPGSVVYLIQIQLNDPNIMGNSCTGLIVRLSPRHDPVQTCPITGAEMKVYERVGVFVVDRSWFDRCEPQIAILV